MIFVSLLMVAMALFGLLIAASAADSSAQFMGLGLMLLAWFFMLGYHGNRVEREARQESRH
jgi:NADH:ubiquinone oxidoreductase subunit 2 (subunit N)